MGDRQSVSPCLAREDKSGLALLCSPVWEPTGGKGYCPSGQQAIEELLGFGKLAGQIFPHDFLGLPGVVFP